MVTVARVAQSFSRLTKAKVLYGFVGNRKFGAGEWQKRDDHGNARSRC